MQSKYGPQNLSSLSENKTSDTFSFPSLIFQPFKGPGTRIAFCSFSSLANIQPYILKSCKMCDYSVNKGDLVKNKSIQANFDVAVVTI